MKKNNLFKFYIYIFIFYILSTVKCYLFSVIIPIYNTAKFLDESIGSILNQTIGFENIQLILVNDGSTDDTEEICLKYQKLYSQNIIYIKIEHGGVSKARNVGMTLAKGKYINFVDSDDKWDYKAFSLISKFFDDHKTIDYVAARIKFFGIKNYYETLDYKFYKTRIVNLTKEYNCIQVSISSSIFKKEYIKGKLFDENVFISEDSKFINSILIVKPIIALVKEAIFYYRRREDYSSAIQNKKYSLEYYFGTPNYVFNHYINISKNLYHKIVPFIQYLLGYEILFRFEEPAYKYMNSSNYNKYIFMIEQFLQQIEDKYILEQKVLPNKYILFMLSKKYKKDLRYEIRFENNSFLYSKYVMINMTNPKSMIIWRNLYIFNNILYLEALDNFWMPRENYFYFCNVGNETFLPKYIENQNYDFITLYGEIEKGRLISFEIPLKNFMLSQFFYFYLSYLEIKIEIFPLFGEFSHLPNINNGYYISNDYILKILNKRLIIFEYDKKLKMDFEKQCYCELEKDKKHDIIKLRKYIKYRNKIKKNLKYKIWIINDKHDKAGDNGEYFFRYLKFKQPIGIQIYFAIDKNCSDYKRLKILDDIIDLNSNKYKNLFLESDKIISSVYNNFIYNPYKKYDSYIRDLFGFDLIFLPNLYMKDNQLKDLINCAQLFTVLMNSTCNKYKYIFNFQNTSYQNIAIFKGNQKNDNLQSYSYNNEIEKKLVIVPKFIHRTKNLKRATNNSQNYSMRLGLSNFFEFYNNLINDKRLISFMKHYNYIGIFCIHETFETIWENFNINDKFSIIEKCDYQNVLLNASLLITDYSNIFYYFLFLKKPVIFSYIDNKEFTLKNYKENYFNYKIGSLGPICKDIKCTIDKIIFEIKNSCIIRKKYLHIINKFLSFDVKENDTEIIFKNTNNKNNLNTYLKKRVEYIIFFCMICIILYKLMIYFRKKAE